MSTPMADLLDHLIDESDDDEIEVQLTFRPGVSTTAGLLRKGPVPGTYRLGTATRATADTPGDFQAGDVVVVEQFFQASAVQSIVRMMLREQPLIVPAGGQLA